MSSQPQVSSEVSRDISFSVLLMMSFGMTIGAGIFLAVGFGFGVAGVGGLLVALALNGLLAVCTAMSFAEMNSAMPGSSGLYDFGRSAFGRGAGFMVAWVEWLAACVAGALNAMVAAFFLSRALVAAWRDVFGAMPLSLLERIVAFLLAFGFVWFHYRGAAETGRSGIRFVYAQMILLPLLAIGTIAWALVQPVRFSNLTPLFPAGWAGVLPTMAFAYAAFAGFEVVSRAGTEAIRPRENLPRAVIYSTYGSVLLYLLLACASVVAYRPAAGGQSETAWQALSSSGVWMVYESFKGLGLSGFLLLGVTVGIASISALHAAVYTSTRISFGLGRGGLLPPRFAAISPHKRTPWVALHFTGLMILLAMMLFSVKGLMVLTGSLCLLLAIGVNLSVIRVRRLMGDELIYGYLLPWFPLLPLAVAGVQVVLLVFMAGVSPVPWLFALAWVVAGIAYYRLYGRCHAVQVDADLQVLEAEETRPTEGQYRVVVAVANPDTALSLVRATHAMSQAKHGTVEILHLVTVPDQVPMSDADQYLQEGKEAITEMKLYLARELPLSFTIRYCRNVARGIICGLREKRTDLLIMGWRGRTRSRGFKLGSTIDPVLECSPCNVVVIKQVADKAFKRVFVPVAGGPNSAFALEVAAMLVDRKDGIIVVLNVRSGGEAIAFNAEQFIEENAGSIAFPHERVHSKTIDSKRVVDTIVDEIESDANACDLVVLGASPRSLLNPFVGETVVNHIARRCNRSLVIAQKAGRLRSWIGAWL